MLLSQVNPLVSSQASRQIVNKSASSANDLDNALGVCALGALGSRSAVAAGRELLLPPKRPRCRAQPQHVARALTPPTACSSSVLGGGRRPGVCNMPPPLGLICICACLRGIHVTHAPTYPPRNSHCTSTDECYLSARRGFPQRRSLSRIVRHFKRRISIFERSVLQRFRRTTHRARQGSRLQ